MTKKEEFISEYQNSLQLFGKVDKLVVAVKLPTGATEIIINTEDIENKMEYYVKAYNDDMELLNNTNVKIVGVMCV